MNHDRDAIDADQSVESREQADLDAIKALDWSTTPTCTDILESIESGKHWNHFACLDKSSKPKPQSNLRQTGLF